MQAERTERAQYGYYNVEPTTAAAYKLMIRWDDGERGRTVAFVDDMDQWGRFVAALKAGADEVAAVHAIDGGES
jgi:hypothetical protein